MGAWPRTEEEFRQRMEERGHASYEQLSRALLAAWPSGLERPKERSLAAMLGRFARGQDQWFRERPQVLAALADLLGMEEEDFEHPARDALNWIFVDFPQLPSLNLVEELPCGVAQLRGEGDTSWPWMDLVPPDGQSLWICAPPGAGKRLRAASMAARLPDVTAREVERLRDVHGAPVPAEGHLLLSVASASPESDLVTLRELATRGRVTVQAPFPMPEPPPSPEEHLRGRPLSSAVLRPRPWVTAQWQPLPGWRLLFLRWVAARLQRADSLLDGDQLHLWVEQADPAAVLFRTPGDLLPLCALVHEHGERWLARQDPQRLADLLAERLVLTPRSTDDRQSAWLQSSGGAALRTLVRSRLRAVDVPLRKGLSRETWARWLPPELAPAQSDPELITQELNRLFELPEQTRARAVQALTEQLTRPNPLLAVERLVRARLLRPDESGALSPAPRFAEEAWLREETGRALGEEAATWGRWTLDRDRRQLVDASLDALSADAFLQLIESTLATPGSLGAVGAVESLFEAAARRLMNGWQGPTPLLHRLWRNAMASRVRRVPEAPLALPLTRVERYHELRHAFYAACWAWSFFVPPPDHLGEDPAWLWPGWGVPTLRELTDGLVPGELVGAPSAWRSYGSTPGFDHLLLLVPRFLERCRDEALPERVPDLLLADAVHLVLTGQRGWRLHGEHLDRVRHDWIEARLCDLLAKEPPAVKEDLALRILRSDSSEGQSPAYALKHWSPDDRGALQGVRDRDHSLYHVLVPYLTAERFLELLDQAAPGHAGSVLHSLPMFPPHLQQAAERWCVGQAALRTSDIVYWLRGRQLPLPASDQALRILLLIAKERSDYTWDVPQLCWDLGPDQALELTRQAWRSDPGAARTRYWFSNAPRDIDCRAPLLQIISEAEPARWPEWVPGWLAGYLPDAGPEAERIYALLQRGREAQHAE